MGILVFLKTAYILISLPCVGLAAYSFYKAAQKRRGK